MAKRQWITQFQYIAGTLITLALILIFILGKLNLKKVFDAFWKIFLIYAGIVGLFWITVWMESEISILIDLGARSIFEGIHMVLISMTLVAIFSYLSPKYYSLGIVGFFVAKDGVGLVDLSGNANALLAIVGLIIIVYSYLELRKHDLRDVTKTKEDEVDMISTELRE